MALKSLWQNPFPSPTKLQRWHETDSFWFLKLPSLILKEFIVKGRQKTILGAFSELTDADREEFLPEYRKRVEAAYQPDDFGLFDLHFDGFLIFGEKL